MELPVHDLALLAQHCRPFLKREKVPETAVELMASRFIAYREQDIDYILDTHDPKTRGSAERQTIESWAKRATFESLEILGTERGGPSDDVGHVEFIARFTEGGREHVHHERSLFERIDGRWFFVSGENIPKPPVRRSETKVGRNDPCPCGSGKKYKKCHG